MPPIYHNDKFVSDIKKKCNLFKAHGHDVICIRMLKLCRDSVWKPLEIIFRYCLKAGTFPNEWKKSNVVPIHKRMIKKPYPFIDLFPSFQFVARCLNV